MGWLVPSETEEPASSVSIRRARNVGALATLGNFAQPVEKGTLYNGDTRGSTGTLSLSRSGRATLRREQWERSEYEHHGRREGETSQAETSERKNKRYACRLFGTNSLKEGAM
jgi:hypothetical protein